MILTAYGLLGCTKERRHILVRPTGWRRTVGLGWPNVGYTRDHTNTKTPWQTRVKTTGTRFQNAEDRVNVARPVGKEAQRRRHHHHKETTTHTTLADSYLDAQQACALRSFWTTNTI